VCPWETLVLHLEQEHEYWAYGFLALLERSLLFEIPVWPSVADFLSPEAEAGEPKYCSLFFLTPGVARVVCDFFWHLLQTMMTE